MKPRQAGLHVPVILFALAAGVTHAQSTWVSVRDRTSSIVSGAKIEILAGPDVVASVMGSAEGEDKLVLDPGTYRVRATAPGFVVGLSETFTQSADATAAVEVTLFPGSALAATVLDNDHQAVVGAELCLELHDWRDYPPPAFGDGLLDAGRECFETNERGQMITPILPLGEFDLQIDAEGLVPKKMTLSLESDFEAQVWRLARGGRVKGRVEDQQGNPVQEAIVRLHHRELEANTESASNADGVFDVAGLVPGPWSVRVEPQNAAVMLRDGIVVKEGAVRDLGVLRTRPGLSIAGSVLDTAGGAVPDAEIQVRRKDRFGRVVRTVKSDDDGRFVAAGLGDDSVDLFVDAPEGYACAVIEDMDPPQHDLDIELDETGTVCGRVLNEDGNVAAGTAVAAVPEELGPLDRYAEKVRATTREVDPETGRFCLEDVHPGFVSVTARAAGYRAAEGEVDVAAGQEAGPVELTLKRGLSLNGTVVGRDTQPLRDAGVRARNSTKVYTDEFGEFLLRGLNPGMNKVVAEHPEYAMAERQVMLPLGDDEEFVIELGAGGTIEGVVTRHGGAAVSGVPVSLSSPDRRQLTDDEGRFRFDSVPPGERRVTRNSRDGYDDFEHRQVQVVEDETVRVEFVLGAVLEGHVLRGGVPVPDAVITLAQPEDVAEYTGRSHGVRRTFSDESGAYRLSGVRPGWGTVTIGLGKQTVVRQIEVPPGDEPRKDLFLPAAPISGTVVNAVDDAGIGGAHVTVNLVAVDGAPESSGSSSYSSSDLKGGIRYNLTSSATCKTTADATGHFQTFADPLPQIEIAAWADGFRWTEVKADPASRTPVTIELSRETRLVIKLRDAGDNPVSGADVCAVLLADDGDKSTNCSRGGSDQVRFSLNEGRYKIKASATGFGTEVLERDMKPRDDGSEDTVTVHLVPGAPLDIRLVGQPTRDASVVSLISPSGADHTDLVREESVDPSTGDRRWFTWSLNPGVWTLTVNPGTGKPIVREVEVIPGSPIEVVVP